MGQFLTIYFPFVIIIVMLILFFLGGFKLVISPKRSTKHYTEIIERRLEELQSQKDTPAKFVEFNKWVQDNSKGAYLENYFKPSWDSYYRKFMQLQQEGVIFTPDVYDFFVEDIFVNKFGKRKLYKLN